MDVPTVVDRLRTLQGDVELLKVWLKELRATDDDADAIPDWALYDADRNLGNATAYIADAANGLARALEDK